MNAKRIDYLNIWLLVIAFVLAVCLPFELFLFSYAFLGPLHYLTEINWLDDRTYFIASKLKVSKLFIVGASLIALYPFLKYLDVDSELNSFKDVTIVFGFVASVCVIIFQKRKALLVALVLSLCFVVMCFFFLPKLIMALGVFLPTLIHVYVFTLLFMIYGLLKQFSKAGLVSVLLLVLVPFVILFLDGFPSNYQVSEFVKDTFLGSGLSSITVIVADVFADINTSHVDLMAPAIVKVQIFIAFAYTYHYLNWFSKTSIIGWKLSLTKKRTLYIAILWLTSIGIYLYDYITGLIVLFFLSLLHVILEFPLNVVTIKALVNYMVSQLKDKVKT